LDEYKGNSIIDEYKKKVSTEMKTIWYLSTFFPNDFSLLKSMPIFYLKFIANVLLAWRF